MFTGIIQSMASVERAEYAGACFRVRIGKPAKWKLVLGQSIAVDGICSTVCVVKAAFFEVEYMPETLRKTTAGELSKGRSVNLERSLTLRDFVDGSLVLGHVDARGTVKKIAVEGGSTQVTIAIPASLRPFMVDRGSVVVNGVSLTVAKKTQDGFKVALIPYTLAYTNLGSIKVGTPVNVEVDLMARYAVRILERIGSKR